MDRNALREQIRSKIASKTADTGKAVLAKIRARRANVTPEESAEMERAWKASRRGKRAMARDRATRQRKTTLAWARQQQAADQRAFTAYNMARAAAGEIGTEAMQANVRRRLENEAKLQGKVISNG